MANPQNSEVSWRSIKLVSLLICNTYCERHMAKAYNIFPLLFILLLQYKLYKNIEATYAKSQKCYFSFLPGLGTWNVLVQSSRQSLCHRSKQCCSKVSLYTGGWSSDSNLGMAPYNLVDWWIKDARWKNKQRILLVLRCWQMANTWCTMLLNVSLFISY